MTKLGKQHLKLFIALGASQFFLSACANLVPETSLKQYQAKRLKTDYGVLPYRILYPRPNEARLDKTSQYPLVIVLHGSGERGTDNRRQLRNGGQLFLGENRHTFPATVVFPQASWKEYWSPAILEKRSRPLQLKFYDDPEPTRAMSKLQELIDKLASEPQVDPKRIYLVGISMGAMATYELSARFPGRFAASLAICGANSKSVIKRIQASNPFWIFHGEQDPIIDVQYSINAHKWISESGASSRLTLYKNTKHNSWEKTFIEPELLTWLFSHSLIEQEKTKDE